MPMWGYYGGWWSWLGPLSMLVFGALVVVGLVLLVRYLVAQGGRSPAGPDGRGDEDALEILKRRYARGEITREEYQQTRRDLLER